MNYLPDAPKFYGLLGLFLLGLAVWHGIDGWIPQERWLERYPEFPRAWYDLGLYKYYAYNRWTALVLGFSGTLCGLVSWHSRRTLERERDVLEQAVVARRTRKR